MTCSCDSRFDEFYDPIDRVQIIHEVHEAGCSWAAEQLRRQDEVDEVNPEVDREVFIEEGGEDGP